MHRARTISAFSQPLQVKWLNTSPSPTRVLKYNAARYTRAVTAAAGVWCQDCVDSIRRLYQSCYIKAHCNIPLILGSALLLLFQIKLNAVFYMWRDFLFWHKTEISLWNITNSRNLSYALSPSTEMTCSPLYETGDTSPGEHPSNHHSLFFILFFSLSFSLCFGACMVMVG